MNGARALLPPSTIITPMNRRIVIIGISHIFLRSLMKSQRSLKNSIYNYLILSLKSSSIHLARFFPNVKFHSLSKCPTGEFFMFSVLYHLFMSINWMKFRESSRATFFLIAGNLSSWDTISFSFSSFTEIK